MGKSKLSAVLDDVPSTLGVPFVNLIFRRLAEWPELLTELWDRTRSIVLTIEFIDFAKALSDIAAPERHVAQIEWPRSMDINDVTRAWQLTQAYVHVQPQLLLLVTGWTASGGGTLRPGGDDILTEMVPAKLTPRPKPGRGSPTADVPMIAASPEDPKTALLFSQMMDQRRHPGIASYYRSLARWPPLLDASWRLLRPYVSTDAYAQKVERLTAVASKFALRLGLPSVRDLDGSADNTDALELLDAWRDVQVPQLMLDTALINAALHRPGR